MSGGRLPRPKGRRGVVKRVVSARQSAIRVSGIKRGGTIIGPPLKPLTPLQQAKEAFRKSQPGARDFSGATPGTKALRSARRATGVRAFARVTKGRGRVATAQGGFLGANLRPGTRKAPKAKNPFDPAKIRRAIKAKSGRGLKSGGHAGNPKNFRDPGSGRVRSGGSLFGDAVKVVNKVRKLAGPRRPKAPKKFPKKTLGRAVGKKTFG